LRPPWGKKLDCFEKGKAKREGELRERNLISEIRGGGEIQSHWKIYTPPCNILIPNAYRRDFIKIHIW